MIKNRMSDEKLHAWADRLTSTHGSAARAHEVYAKQWGEESRLAEILRWRVQHELGNFF